MNKFYQAILNTSGDARALARVQVLDSGGSVVTIYADDGGTRFTDSTGANVNYCVADDEGMVEFYWTAATGQTLQILDSAGNLERSVADFANNFSATAVALAATGGAALVGTADGETVEGRLGRYQVASVAAMQALTPANGDTAYLRLSGRAGMFVFSTANLSTEVAADTYKGLYIAPTSDATGASGAWVREYSGGAINVQWFGAIGYTSAALALAGADQTAVIQHVVSNYFNVEFPRAWYPVTTITCQKAGQKIDFNGAYLVAFAAVATTSVIQFAALQCSYHGLKVYGAYNGNYTAGIQITALSASVYSGRSNWYDCKIYATVYGILYGVIGTSVDAPVSENHWFGGETRDVERVIYMNQKNGFIEFHGTVVDCQRYEWESENPGVFVYADSYASNVEEGWLTFSDCTFLKGQSTDGYLHTCKGGTLEARTIINNCKGEAACTNFRGRQDGGFEVHGYTNNLFNNTVAAFIEFDDASTGVFMAEGLRYARGPGGEANTFGLIDSQLGAQWECSFTNCYFENQNILYLLDSDSRRTTECNVKFKNCWTSDATYGTKYLDTSGDSLQPALVHLTAAGVGAAPPAAQFQTVPASGSNILVQTDASPVATRCIDMTSGTAGVSTLYCWPSAGPNVPSPRRHGIFEWWSKAVTGANGADMTLTIYHNEAGTGLSSTVYQSNGATGGFGNIRSGNTAAIGWTRNQMLLPDIAPLATNIGIEFVQNNTSQNIKIGGLRVY